MINSYYNYFKALNLTEGARVILKVDFNFDFNQSDDFEHLRYVQILNMVKWLLSQKMTIILLGHKGRPDGKNIFSESLISICKKIELDLGLKISFIEASEVDELVVKCKGVSKGEVALLENVRFWKWESEVKVQNNQIVASREASYFLRKMDLTFDVFIHNAFSVAHRLNTSNFLGCWSRKFVLGPDFSNEVKQLSQILKKKDQFKIALVLGGGKILEKLSSNLELFNKVDSVLLGVNVLNELPMKKVLFSQIINDSKKKKVKIHIPSDSILLREKEFLTDKCYPWDTSMDIGVNTIFNYCSILERHNLIIVNGPIGFYRNDDFYEGTKAILEIVKKRFQNGSIVIAGGGSTYRAIKNFGCEQKFHHISSGGGAMLYFLSRGSLPVLEVIIDNERIKRSFQEKIG